MTQNPQRILEVFNLKNKWIDMSDEFNFCGKNNNLIWIILSMNRF